MLYYRCRRKRWPETSLLIFDWGRNQILFHNIMYFWEESNFHAKVLNDYKIQFASGKSGSWSGNGIWQNIVKIERVVECEIKRSFTLTFSVTRKQ